MKETSIFVRLICKVWQFLKNVFLNSGIYKLCCSVSDGVANCYSKSVTHSVLTCKEIEENSNTSVFYKMYRGLVKLFKNVSRGIFSNIDKAKGNGVLAKTCHYLEKGSVCANGISKPLSPFFCPVGLFSFVTLIIFCVPHSLWNNVFGLLVSFVGVIILMCSCNYKNIPLNLDRAKTYLSLIMFMLCVTVSTVFSADRADSIRVFAFFLTSFIMCITISLVVANKESFALFVKMMYLVVVITSIVGIVQAIMKVEADASLTDLTLNANMPGRVFSTLGNPNNFAQMLVLFMPFCFAYAINAKGRLKKVILVGIMALPLVALLQTYSRSGWIAFAVSVVMFVVLSNKRLVPLFILVCIVAIPFLPETILARILTIGNLSDSSSSYRMDIWSGASLVLSNWWATGIGIGPGAFKKIYPPYSFGTTRDVAHSHMQFLEVFIETGIVGFICFVWMTFEIIRRGCMASKTQDKCMRNYAIASASSMTGIIFVGLFEYYWFYPRVMFAFFICAGLSIASYFICKGQQQE